MLTVTCSSCGGPCAASFVQRPASGAKMRRAYYCCPLCGLGAVDLPVGRSTRGAERRHDAGPSPHHPTAFQAPANYQAPSGYQARTAIATT